MPNPPSHAAHTTSSESSLTLATLKRVFGFDTFRGSQAAIVNTVLGGGDALVLMPTGGGKSLCYQLPALLRNGVAIVVSPLIALMQDQVDALNELGVAASFLNSSLSMEDANRVERDLRSGKLKLVYVAPERLNTARFLALLDDLYERDEIALFAIDEAHCVSQWGHDFREDYLQLTVLHDRFPKVPRIALTATADEATREEIRNKLALQEAAQFVSSFDRPNIHYTVADRSDERKQLLEFLDDHEDEAGIVYCISRAKVDDTASWLKSRGFNAMPYHAGLDADTRRGHQTRFLQDDAVVMVATVAFGMGIDKPDVRFVAHLDLPKSIEGYYQETGRAGRDGAPAFAWMTYGLADVVKQLRFIEESDAGEDFKRLQKNRLDRLLALAETTDCRRAVLLDYFSEPQPAGYRCMNCDNCNSPPETWDATKPAQMFLSAAVRTGQFFGGGHLIDVLRGSKSEKVLARGHDKLPVYGIGAAFDADVWRIVIRQLISRGALFADAESYGALKLTEAARPLLRGEEVLRLRTIVVKPKGSAKLPRERSKSASKSSNAALEHMDSAARARYAALKAWRSQTALAASVPAFVVFSDATLRGIAERNPSSSQQLLEVSGVGEAKLANYGAALLALLSTEHAEVAELVADEGAIEQARSVGLTGTIGLSYALFKSGHSVQAISQSRVLAPTTVFTHLATAITANALTLSEVLPDASPESIERMRQALTKAKLTASTGTLKAAFEDMGEEGHYGWLRCVEADMNRTH
ncbi:MAG: DNA helicase RecQ [Betaproteobacteria bacterium]|nr:MAG: DNA helicase RecQ [Betaproteobacteria bacterium]